MSNKYISFIVPYSPNRKGHMINLLYNLDKYYSNYELILCEQGNEGPFKRGQLRNLGYKHSSGEVVMFMDVDYRLPSMIPFIEYIERYDRPILYWNKLIYVDEPEQGEFTNQENILGYAARGGMAFGRAQYEKFGGYSNLTLDWGYMDEILGNRSAPKRLDGKLYHVRHAPEDSHDMNDPSSRYNSALRSTDHKRDPDFDGYRQTIATAIEVPSTHSNLKHFIFSNITVPDDFKYMNILNRVPNSIQ